MTQRELNPIIVGFGTRDGKRILGEAFKDIPLGFCLSVSLERQFAPSLSAREFVWHKHRDCQFGNYPVDWNNIDPIDEELIEKMSHCETLFLRMMDRLERVRVITYQQRKRAYLRHLRYWNHVLTHHGINFYLSSNYPHECFDFVLYHLCKQRGIKALMLHAGLKSIPGTFFFNEDWENPVPGLEEEYQLLLRSGEDTTLSPEFEEHYQELLAGGEETTPWYTKQAIPPSDAALAIVQRRRKAWWMEVFSMLKTQPRAFVVHVFKFLNRFLTSQFWLRFFELSCSKKSIFAMNQFYKSQSSEPDLSQKYIYFPLHYQPECTTSPMAGAFVDQGLIAQMLSALLPEGVFIYVKEHPFQGDKCRSLDFYRDLKELRRVRLVPRNFSSSKLITHCIAVATATGTAGFEALFREVPVLMFGHRFNQYAPGVYQIHCKEDCQRALHAILDEGEKPSLRDVKIFLKAVENKVLKGYLGSDDKEASLITEEENVGLISGALNKHLQSVVEQMRVTNC